MRRHGGNGASFLSLHPRDRLQWISDKIMIISQNAELKKCLLRKPAGTKWLRLITTFCVWEECNAKECKIIKKRPVMETKLCLLFKSGYIRARLKNGPISRGANYFKSCHFQRMRCNLHGLRISWMIGVFSVFGERRRTIKRQMAAF